MSLVGCFLMNLLEWTSKHTARPGDHTPLLTALVTNQTSAYPLGFEDLTMLAKTCIR